jgi:hypothetical protein
MAVNNHTKRLITLAHGSRLKYNRNLLWNFFILENVGTAVNYRDIFIKFVTEFTITMSYPKKLD